MMISLPLFALSCTWAISISPKLPTSCNRKNTTEENIYVTDATENVSLIDQYHKINTSILKNIRKYFPWWICMSYLYHTATRKNMYKFKMVIRKINHERHGLLFSYVLKKRISKRFSYKRKLICSLIIALRSISKQHRTDAPSYKSKSVKTLPCRQYIIIRIAIIIALMQKNLNTIFLN
jgi:hypothetical protein